MLVRRRCRVLWPLAVVVSLALACGSDGGDGGATAEGELEQSPSITAPPTTTCAPANEVVVFLNPAVTDDVVAVVEAGLRDLTGVVDLRYVDQQAAYDEFVRLFADSPELLATVDPEILPPSFRVVLDDPARVEDVQRAAESLSGVGQVVVSDAEAAPC